ncbi:MAG: YXWGXW repeat-containing protein [Bacteroidota bacterium]
MKTQSRKIILFFGLLMSFSFAASSQIVVRVRPAAPVVRGRPLAPSPRHVWIDGGWVYRGHGYVWTNGYWMTPRPGMVWVQGRWRHSHRGYVWVPGQWRRRR